MKKIKFSIILPTYNRAHMIGNAIDSVLSQDYEHWELIIIDDGSTDKTNELIEAYKDDRIIYYFQDNQGKGPARNRGVELATGDYICFLDSDDSYKPNHLSSFVKGIEQYPVYNIYRTGAEIYDNSSAISFQSKDLIKEDREYQIEFIWKEYFALLDLCIEASLAKSFKIPNCNSWEDKHYIIQIVLRHGIKQLNSRTVVINDHLERGVLVDIVSEDNRISPFACMDHILKIENELSELLSSRFIQHSKLTLSFVQIINLIKIKEYKTAYKCYRSSVFKYPILLIFKKSLGLLYYIFFDFVKGLKK